MKIKTANVRILKLNKLPELREVNVKQIITFNGELFFIHKSWTGTGWSVSHYKTGLGAGVQNARTVALAKQKFDAVMEITAHVLQKAVDCALKKYGAANELPEDAQ